MPSPKCDELRHPVQPIGFSEDGTIRFKANAIVRDLLDRSRDELGHGLNEISAAGYSPEDYTHLMQLIGYSVNGYGELSTSPPEIVQAADGEMYRLDQLRKDEERKAREEQDSLDAQRRSSWEHLEDE